MNIFGQFFKLWKETIFIGVISEISFYRRPPWPFYILETPNFSLENPIFYLLTPNLRRGLPYFHWRPKAFFFINPPIIINKPWRDGDVGLRWKGVSNEIGGSNEKGSSIILQWLWFLSGISLFKVNNCKLYLKWLCPESWKCLGLYTIDFYKILEFL